MKLGLILLFFATCNLLLCQDTVSIYFEFGKSKLLDNQINILNQISTNFDLTDLDSVHYIGMTDSVGKVSSNIKLSLKRATHVQKYCEVFFDKTIPYQTFSEGEKVNPEQKRNRRVDIILYFPTQEIEQTQVANQLKGCYRIDYKSIAFCHLRTIIKRGKEYILLENDWVGDTKRFNELYYGTINETGEFEPKKVRWKWKKTGSLWWKKKRKLALVPKKEYDKYLLFWIDPEPCDSNCHENFKEKTPVVNIETCRWGDATINRYLQYRYPLLNRNSVKARVPREFIDSLATYYTFNNSWQTIEWKHKRGNRKKYYLFTKLPVIKSHDKHPTYAYFNLIFRDQLCHKNPSICIDKWELERTEIKCGTRGVTGEPLIAEIGGHYQNSQLVGYAALGTRFSLTKIDSELFFGIHTRGTFYGSARFRYNFFTFWLDELNLKSSWRQFGDKTNWWTCRMYFGTELKTSIGKVKYEYLEHNVHFGLSFMDFGRNIPSRIFIQSGIAYNALLLNSTGIYTNVQLGIQFAFF